VNLRGCRINNIPKEAFEGETTKHLVSLDLSYNDLTDLPSSFNAVNLPYFYGLEISYNEFSKFPFEPFDCAGLTIYGIRGQRDKNGERCLSEWPTGVYQHTGLRGLYIGSNNLGKIEDTISPLIYYLEISDNPNIIFDASGVCYEYSIGAYYLIFDKTQDIRGCSYMR
jgi:Leucine-rich repeat (LRR) protein